MIFVLRQFVFEPPVEVADGQQVEVVVHATARVLGGEVILEPRQARATVLDPAAEPSVRDAPLSS